MEMKKQSNSNLLRRKVCILNKLGVNLYKHRKKHGLSMDDMSSELRISPSYYLYLEHGKRRPSHTILSRIASLLRVKNDTTIKWYDEPSPVEWRMKEYLGGVEK